MEILIILDNKTLLDKEIKIKPFIIKSSILTLLVIIVVVGISTPVNAIIDTESFNNGMDHIKNSIDITTELGYRLVTTGSKELFQNVAEEITGGEVPIFKPFTLENQKAFINELVNDWRYSDEIGVKIIRGTFRFITK